MKKKLLAALLALTMVVSLLPTWAVAENYVAQIGEQGYETLQKAIEYAGVNDTISLLTDYTVPDVVAVYSPSRDGGQHPLSPTDYTTHRMLVVTHKSNPFTIDGNNNTVTGGITDSIYLGEDTQNIIYGFPNVTLKNINFTIEGNVLEVMGENTALTIESGTYTSTAVNGVVLMASGGTTNISGGTFTGATAIQAGMGGKVEISGGYFKGALSDGSEYGVGFAGTITITGGKFSAWPKEYVDGGYKVIANTDSDKTTYPYKVVADGAEGAELEAAFEPAATNVAKIDDTEYATLADAIAAVPTDGTETTITMIGDETINTNAGVTVGKDMNVVLDLNGFTIDGPAPEATTSYIIKITNGGILTVKDGSQEGTGRITAKATGDVNKLYGNYAIDNQSGKFTLESGTIESDDSDTTVKKEGLYWAITTGSYGATAETTINGGTVIGHSYQAVRAYVQSGGSSKLTINGGVIRSETKSPISIQLCDKQSSNFELNITDGTIVSDAGKTPIYAYGDIQSNPNEMDLAISKLSVSGGQFNSGNSVSDVVDWSNSTFGDCDFINAPVKCVSGGLYTFEVSAAQLATGYECVENTDETTSAIYPYKVVAKAPEVEVKQVEAEKKTEIKTEVAQQVVKALTEAESLTPEQTTALNAKVETAVTNLTGNTEVTKAETKITEAVKTETNAIIAKAAAQAVTNGKVETADAFIGGENTTTDTKIEIKLETVKVDAQTVVSAAAIENITVNTAVYDVKPIATVTTTVTDTQGNIETKSETVELTNEDLNGQPVTVRLAVPKTTATKAKVTHTSAGYDDEVFYADIKGTSPNQYVEIQMTHFSSVTVETLDNVTEGTVAVIEEAGGEYGCYTTLKAAVDAAQDGQTITLLADVTESVVVNKNVVIDGQSHTIKIDNATAKSIQSIAKLSDEEAFDYSGIVAVQGATVELKNLTIQGDPEAASGVYALTHENRYCAVASLNSNVTLTNCNLKDIKYKGHLEGMQGGFGIYAVGTGSLTLKDTDISNFDKAGVIVRAGTKLIVDGGTVTGWGETDVIAQNGIQFADDATIKNVTIKNLKYLGPDYESVALYNVGAGKASVTNVTCDKVDIDISTEFASTPGTTVVNSGKYEGSIKVSRVTPSVNPSIKGGYFKKGEDVSAYLATGYECVENDDEATKEAYPHKVQAKAVAQIGDVKYPTLADAIAAVPENGTATINMLKGHHIDSDLTIDSNKNITLNLNDFMLTGKTVTIANAQLEMNNGTFMPDSDCIGVQVIGKTAANTFDTPIDSVFTMGADFTLDVTSHNPNYPGILIEGNGAVLNVYGKIIGTTTAGAANRTEAIMGNGTVDETKNNGGTVINIYDGAEISVGKIAFYLPQKGVTNIYGGTISGYAGIGIKSGDLNISGGEIIGTANDVVLPDSSSSSSGIGFDGSAIVVDSNLAYAGQMNINITGGTVKGNKAYAIHEIGNDASQNIVHLNISGGQIFGGATANSQTMVIREKTKNDGVVSLTGGIYTDDVSAYVPTGYKCVALDATADADAIADGYNYKVIQQEKQIVTESKATVDTTDNTKVKVDDKTIEVKVKETEEDEATDNTDTEVATKVATEINKLLDNTEVSNFGNTGIHDAVTKDTVQDGSYNLTKILKALKEKATTQYTSGSATTTADNVITVKTAETATGEDFTNTDVKTELKIAFQATVVTTETKTEEQTQTQTIVKLSETTYDVKPYATIEVTNGNNTETVTVQITNDMITAPITFRLPVPEYFGDYATVTHTPDESDNENNKYKEETFVTPVHGSGDKKYVELSSDHFSTFKLADANVTTGDVVSVNGVNYKLSDFDKAVEAASVDADNDGVGDYTMYLLADVHVGLTDETDETSFITLNEDVNVDRTTNAPEGKKFAFYVEREGANKEAFHFFFVNETSSMTVEAVVVGSKTEYAMDEDIIVNIVLKNGDTLVTDYAGAYVNVKFTDKVTPPTTLTTEQTTAGWEILSDGTFRFYDPAGGTLAGGVLGTFTLKAAKATYGDPAAITNIQSAGQFVSEVGDAFTGDAIAITVAADAQATILGVMQWATTTVANKTFDGKAYDKTKCSATVKDGENAINDAEITVKLYSSNAANASEISAPTAIDTYYAKFTATADGYAPLVSDFVKFEITKPSAELVVTDYFGTYCMAYIFVPKCEAGNIATARVTYMGKQVYDITNLGYTFTTGVGGTAILGKRGTTATEGYKVFAALIKTGTDGVDKTAITKDKIGYIAYNAALAGTIPAMTDPKDVNASKLVDLADAVAVMATNTSNSTVISKLSTYMATILRCDVDGNGKVDTEDAGKIKTEVTKIPADPPATGS